MGSSRDHGRWCRICTAWWVLFRRIWWGFTAGRILLCLTWDFSWGAVAGKGFILRWRGNHVDFLELQRDSRVMTGNSGCLLINIGALSMDKCNCHWFGMASHVCSRDLSWRDASISFILCFVIYYLTYLLFPDLIQNVLDTAFWLTY